MGIDWEGDETRPVGPSTQANPAAPLARRSAAAAWRAVGSGFAVYAVLDWTIEATVAGPYQPLWRVLMLCLCSFAAATYFWASVHEAARAPRLLVWFAALVCPAVFAVVELALSTLVPQSTVLWRLSLIAATGCATAIVFNRITGRLLAQAAAERATLERAHADALRLEGVMLAARTMQHRINNSLAVVTAYAERLANDADLPPPLRGRALVVLQAAEEAAGDLSALGRVTRLEQDARFGMPLLDIERSIQTDAAAEQTHERSSS